MEKKHFQEMNPAGIGGEMIDFVYDQESTWNELPWKFSRHQISQGAIGLAAAIDWFRRNWFGEYPSAWTRNSLYLSTKDARKFEGVIWHMGQGPGKHSESLVFYHRWHPSTWRVATALDMKDGGSRRTSLCTTLMRWLDVPATCRASFYIYNTLQEELFLEALW